MFSVYLDEIISLVYYFYCVEIYIYIEKSNALKKLSSHNVIITFEVKISLSKRISTIILTCQINANTN
jgi:hypothetical protein